jgi:prolyl-tRNA synthetase
MTSEQREKDKRAFLAAYDEGYIWASEAVAAAIRDLLEAMEQKAAADANVRVMPPNAPGYPQVQAAAQARDTEAQERYKRCLLEMRRDCGFPDSGVGYRVVSFA